MSHQRTIEKATIATETALTVRPTRLARFAWTVEDIVATKAVLKKYFDMNMRDFDVGSYPLKVGIDEHGLEPLQPLAPNLAPFADARLPVVEIALSVDDAEATKARLDKAGILPFHKNHMKAPDSDEYNYGASVFHGIPLMVGTIGDAEQENTAAGGFFRDLESAPPPKMGVVTIEVESIKKVAADFERLFDMHFVPDDACGLGKRAVVGAHRIRLVEEPIVALRGQYPPPVVSVDLALNDVETVRQGLVDAGFTVLFERRLKSGRNVYYFGKNLLGFLVGIYPFADDAEMRGGQKLS